MTKIARSGWASTPQLYDELLVTLVRSGDRKAAELLVKRWHPRLLRAARRYANDEGRAEQLVQDCWLGIWRGVGGLRDPARFAPWVFSILRKKGAATIRTQIRERERDVEAQELAAPPHQEDSAALAQAFATLAPYQRLAAHLHFVEGFTLREIAQVQDVPIGTAKTRLFHARRKLKAALTGLPTTNSEGETV